jgi:uncharacterized protein (DUF2147 family)
MAKKLTIAFITACFIMSYSGNVLAQNKKDIVGVWQTRGDNGEEAESDIKIWNDNGEYKAKIIKVYDKESQNNRCTECDKDDPRYNQKIEGMTILYKMKKTGDNEWTKGKILDPENGSIYDCKMWLEGGKLVIRGYIGFSLLGRSQKWVRLE